MLPNYFSYGSYRTSSLAISAWDIAYTLKGERPQRDYSVGAVGSKDEFRGAIVQDIQRGQFTKHNLIETMVFQAVQFRLHTIFLEATNGVHFLHDEIIEALRQAGLQTTRVDYIPVASVPNAKEIRYQSLYDALIKDEMWFAL